MNRFAAEMNNLDEWPKYCLRNNYGYWADGFGCSYGSY